MYPKSTAALLATALLLAACSAGDGSGDPVPASSESPPVTQPPAAPPPSSAGRSYDGDTYPAGLTEYVAIAVDDLAARLRVGTVDITVVTVEDVVWPDGGLGCPRPGVVYPQVLTDGIRILLAHNGVEFAYHSGGTVEPFLCIPLDLKPQDGTGGREGTLPTEELGGPGGQPDV
jgi:hypothetical protein